MSDKSAPQAQRSGQERPRLHKLVPPPSGTLADWAQEYARCGWPIYPFALTREPLVNADMQRVGSTDVTLITAWWGEWPDANIALPTGSMAGWLAVELPVVETQRAARMLLPPGGTKITRPNGSRLLLYRSPASTEPMPTQQWIDPTTGEVLAILHGDGDFVFLPPSRDIGR
jgi:hypothetical protein